jgi:hypothetical protein
MGGRVNRLLVGRHVDLELIVSIVSALKYMPGPPCALLAREAVRLLKLKEERGKPGYSMVAHEGRGSRELMWIITV